jgi:hypothetical protein
MATATAIKEKNPITIFNTFMEERSPSLRKVLPKHIPPDRFIRVVLTAVQAMRPCSPVTGNRSGMPA